MIDLDKYTSVGEAHYVRKLVANILSRGHYISVNDGGEWTLKHSRKASQILGALGTTGHDHIRIEDDAARGLGVVMLVYGNDPSGEEVISDHTDNPLCNAIFDEVMGMGYEGADR